MTQAGAVTTIRALTIGAVDFVAKPSGAISLDFAAVRDELVTKIRTAAKARIARGTMSTPSSAVAPTPSARAAAPASASGLAPVRPGTTGTKGKFERIVVIGSSTGGPKALGAVVPALPADGRTAYLIVQHMPAGFTHSLAERLDGLSQLSVREAKVGDRLQVDTALVAPGDFHLRVTPSGEVTLDQEPKVHGVRPSVDVTLYSVAQHFAPRTVAAILTGMGSDGAAAAVAIRQAGGTVLAEDESTCVVWGMPRAVVERGGADRVVPLDAMAAAIVDALGARALSART
jgi:two-component system chemotaxis response regulator CheB